MSLSLMRSNPRAWRLLRTQVLIRDHHQCQLRLRGCTRMATAIDHIIPRNDGGSDAIDNLQASCGNCNLLKGAGDIRFLEQQQPQNAVYS